MAEATNSTGDGLGHRIDWISRNERNILLVGIIFQLLILIGMIVWQAMPIWTGDTFLLRVEPIDPRDLMRGDYVILSYEMSMLPVEGLEGERWGWPDQRPVFVMLEKEEDGKHWRGVKASTAKPTSGRYIEGKTSRGRLIFGIESFFLQEGSGKAYESAIRDKRVSAKISLSRDGRAALVDLQYDR